MRRFSTLQALLGLSLAGCCTSSEDVIAMARRPEDAAAPCEQICQRALVPRVDDHSFTFLECEEGSSEDGDAEVLCTFVDAHCPR